MKNVRRFASMIGTQMPLEWSEILQGETFVIHLASHNERLETCKQRMYQAGFANFRIFDAVNGHDPGAWAQHQVRFDGSWMVPRVAGCMLSHLAIWKKVIDDKLPFATVFEDDVVFHKQWHNLAHQYYVATPKTCDMIFMGHHCGNVVPHIHIVQVPVYCLHAYIITYEGAKKLYHMITQYPYDDNHAIDMMLVRLMGEQLRGHPHESMPQLSWYAWNSEMFPDEEAAPLIHPHLVHKDKGLVFQQWYDSCRMGGT